MDATPPRSARLVTPDHEAGAGADAKEAARRRRREVDERQRQRELLDLAAELKAKEKTIVSLQKEKEKRRGQMDEAQEELTRLRAKLLQATTSGKDAGAAASSSISAEVSKGGGDEINDDDLIALDAAYVSRLCDQVRDSRSALHWLERQLPFVKG